MAFMDQEKKAKIAAELKKVMPRDWQYSLAVNHHSTIVLTIQAAPVDLIAMVNKRNEYKVDGYYQVNEFYLNQQFSGDVLATLKKIKAALNTDNFDHSDVQTDYFNVGHYVSINIGKWNKPFQVLSAPVKPAEPTYEELKTRIAALKARLSS